MYDAADRIVVLKHVRNYANFGKENTDPKELIEIIAGRLKKEIQGTPSAESIKKQIMTEKGDIHKSSKFHRQSSIPASPDWEDSIHDRFTV